MDDVTIVGAGPAGAIAALVLSRAGVRVSLLDKAHFPRNKPCAEYISPGASKKLIQLGLDSIVRRLALFPLRGFRIARGRGELAGYYRPDDSGFAASRTEFDMALVTAATAAGATLCEGVRATSTEQADGRSTIEAIGPNGRRYRFCSKFIIGADGINSLVAHRLGLRRPDQRLRRIGLVSHVEGVSGLTDMGEMHIGEGYFCGLAPFGTDVANAAMVVQQRDAPEFRRDPTDFFVRRLRALPSLSHRCQGLRVVAPVTSVGPMAVNASSVWSGRTLLTGDAGGFYDPFTGQGIYRAIRGGEMAAQSVIAFLTSGDSRVDFTRYVTKRRLEFGGSWLVERLTQKFLAHPSSLDRVLRNLARRQGLADTLVRFTGDTTPARTVLNPAYLLRVLS